MANLETLRILFGRRFFVVTVSVLFSTYLNELSAQSNRFEAGISAKARGQYLTAIRSWQPLAEDGMAEAQVNLGHMYSGLGVNVDFEQALYWYIASESDQRRQSSISGCLLGRQWCYAAFPTSIDYFERAEELGVSDASYMLGTLQLSESRVPINLEGTRTIRQAALAEYLA